MATTKMIIDEDNIDLEDDQFKRARLDTSIFPHYELKSNDMNDDDIVDMDEFDNKNKNGKRKKKGTDDFFYASMDSNDNTGEFPWMIDNKSKQDENHEMKANEIKPISKQIEKKMNDDDKLQINNNIKNNNNDYKEQKIEIEESNPLYVYNYWLRYHSLSLHWPRCDGTCGNKFGKLIHNELYGKSKSESKTEMDDISVLFIDNYQLSSEDMNSIKLFSTLNPMNIQSDMVIQMWSFLDNLKGRVEEHNAKQTEIEHDKKVHELINKDIESTLNVKEIISKEFLCYSTSIRRYLISLLDSFNDNNNNYNNDDNRFFYRRYCELLKLLKDKENIICDDKQTLDIWSRLTNLKESKHYFILYQLCRYSCYNQANTLFKELKQNGYHTISPNLYTKQMVRIIKTPQYAVMRKYNLELTAEEIISILIYTGSDQISKRVRESLIMEQRGCKWTHMVNNLVSAVDKMHKFIVQTKRKEDLPEKLYYAIGQSISKKRVQYFDVLSATANFNLAQKFMQKGTMIIFDNANKMLQSSRFVAAPLNWITSRNKQFSEWLVCCIKIHQSTKNKLDSGNSEIICTDYETINFRSMETWRQVVDASMILEQTNESLAIAANTCALNNDKWECVHCRIKLPIYYFQGSILTDNMECPSCRRFNLFSFNVPQRIVSCYNCKYESMLKEYIVQEKNGAICPKCNQLQLEAFKKSSDFKDMIKYMSIDNGFKQYQKRLKLLEQQQQNAKKQYIGSYPSFGGNNEERNINSTGTTMESLSEKKKKKGGFFKKWGKEKTRSTKSANLNDIEENTAIVEEDGFD